MKENDLQTIRLGEAVLCMDCNCVSNTKKQCACGSQALLFLEPVLNQRPLPRMLGGIGSAAPKSA